jgi:hypothetical protein
MDELQRLKRRNTLTQLFYDVYLEKIKPIDAVEQIEKMLDERPQFSPQETAPDVST